MRVVLIDHEIVRVRYLVMMMAVVVAVLFVVDRVIVLVMLIVHVCVFVPDRGMGMDERARIVARPQHESCDARDKAERTEHDWREVRVRIAEPSGERLGHEPARVGQREMRGKDRRAAVVM